MRKMVYYGGVNEEWMRKREEKKMKVMNIDNPEKFFEVVNPSGISF